jgi:hypothetical protein
LFFRWVPRLFVGIAAGLVPWVGYLAVSLPRRNVSHDYRGTWVGFDVILVLTLLRAAWLVSRRTPSMILSTCAASTLLVVDAWFDVTTAERGAARTQALWSAFLLELPGAVLCAVLARRGIHILLARAAATSGGRIRGHAEADRPHR